MATVNKKPLPATNAEIDNNNENTFKLTLDSYDNAKGKWVQYTFIVDDWALKRIAGGITRVLTIRKEAVKRLITDVKNQLPNNIEI